MKTKNYLIVAALAAGCVVSTAGLAAPVTSMTLTDSLYVAGTATQVTHYGKDVSGVKMDVYDVKNTLCYTVQVAGGGGAASQGSSTQPAYTGGCKTSLSKIVITPNKSYWGQPITYTLTGGVTGDVNLALVPGEFPKCAGGESPCIGQTTVDGVVVPGTIKIKAQESAV